MTKLASVISTIALGTSFLACAGLGVAVANDAFGNKPVEVEAAKPIGTSDGRLFIDMSIWKADGDKVSLWMFGGSASDSWTPFVTDSVSGDICSVNLPNAGYTKFIAVRRPSSKTEPGWDDEHNRIEVTVSSSWNCVKPKWDGQFETSIFNPSTFASGSNIYFDTGGKDSVDYYNNWVAANAVTGAYFWNSSADTAKVQLTNVLGFDKGNPISGSLYNLRLFGGIVPTSLASDGGWIHVLFFRAETLNSTWWNNSQDLSKESNNVFKLNNWSDKAYGSFNYTHSDSSRADDFGVYTYDQLGAHCGTNYSPTNKASTFSTAWSNLKTEWATMSSAAKSSFVSMTADEKSANQYEVGAHYYDTCVQKYFSSDNFAGRGAKALTFTPAVFETEKKNYIEVFIACGAILILIGFSLAFLKVKRKEQ